MSKTAHTESLSETVAWIKPGTLGEAPEPEQSVDTGGSGFRYGKAMAALGVETGDDRHSSSLDMAMIWLLEKRPFYAYCLSDVVRRETYAVPTLAVTCRGGRIEMLYNPDFLAIHNLRHNVGFIQHELGHVMHGHLSEGRRRPELYLDRLVNVAMDLSVDSNIQSQGDQPDWVLLPSKLRRPVAGVDDPGSWPNFPERATWEQYWELLNEIRENFPEYFKSVVVLCGMPVPDNGRAGETFDDHGQWRQDGSDQPEIIDEAVRNMVRAAHVMAESRNQAGGNMRGYMSGEMYELVQKLMAPGSVPFGRLMRMFLASHVDTRRRPSVTRVSRRRHVIPGSRFSRRLRVLWCRDTSGSVGSDELVVGFNELWSLSRETGVSILVQDFDHGLQGQPVDLDVSHVRAAATFKGRGGTDFVEPLNLAAAMKPDVCIVTTDGHAPVPQTPPIGVPVMWLLTHNGQAPAWGMVVRLPSRQQIESGYRAVIEQWR